MKNDRETTVCYEYANLLFYETRQVKYIPLIQIWIHSFIRSSISIRHGLVRSNSHTFRSQNDIQLELFRCWSTWTLMLAHTRWKLLQGFKVNDQIVFDSKDGVGREPWIVLWIDLCNNLLVVVVRDL